MTETITTFTGRQVDPFNLTTSDIHPLDIAHALSNLCRFTGHTREFYSVAQHCVVVSYLMPTPFELYGLLHDAGEAYFNDLSTPIKHAPEMAAYREAEMWAELQVYWRFGLEKPTPELFALIKKADSEALDMERKDLFGKGPFQYVSPHPPKDIRQVFINRFNKLFQDLKPNTHGQTTRLRQ